MYVVSFVHDFAAFAPRWLCLAQDRHSKTPRQCWLMTLSESPIAVWSTAGLVATLLVAFALSFTQKGRKNRKNGKNGKKGLRITQRSPSRVQALAHTSTEDLAIEELRQRFSKGEEPPEGLLLQLAWSRKLDVDAAVDVCANTWQLPENSEYRMSATIWYDMRTGLVSVSAPALMSTVDR